jgi:hypothetical protein
MALPPAAHDPLLGREKSGIQLPETEIFVFSPTSLQGNRQNGNFKKCLSILAEGSNSTPMSARGLSRSVKGGDVSKQGDVAAGQPPANVPSC